MRITAERFARDFQRIHADLFATEWQDVLRFRARRDFNRPRSDPSKTERHQQRSKQFREQGIVNG